MTIYGNVLIDDEDKLSALKFTLPQWLEYWGAPCVLRVRGRLSPEVTDFCASFKSVKCIIGSSFIQWRRQTLWDIESIQTPFIMLYLEDHMVSPSAPRPESILRNLVLKKISIFQYSWFSQYSKIREVFSQGDSQVIPITISSQNLKSFLGVDFRWIVSMTSIFDKTYFQKILRSPRPYIRRKDPKAPYDVEQRPTSTWYLPMNFGISKNEIGISLDDNNGVEGYSAISRGLYLGNKSEWAKNHEGKLSTIHLARQLKQKLFRETDFSHLNPKIRSIIVSAVFWPSYINYSVKAVLFIMVDTLIEIVLKHSKKKQS